MWIDGRIGTMSQDEQSEDGVVVLDVRDLVDGVNNPDLIVPKLVLGYQVIETFKYRLAVRCVAGVSRSNAVAAGIISLLDGRDYMDCLNTVREAVPRSNPNPLIIDSVEKALKEIDATHKTEFEYGGMYAVDPVDEDEGHRKEIDGD